MPALSAPDDNHAYHPPVIADEHADPTHAPAHPAPIAETAHAHAAYAAHAARGAQAHRDPVEDVEPAYSSRPTRRDISVAPLTTIIDAAPPAAMPPAPRTPPEASARGQYSIRSVRGIPVDAVSGTIDPDERKRRRTLSHPVPPAPSAPSAASAASAPSAASAAFAASAASAPTAASAASAATAATTGPAESSPSRAPSPPAPSSREQVYLAAATKREITVIIGDQPLTLSRPDALALASIILTTFD